MRVGVAYNLKRIAPRRGGADDDEAEFDAPTTVAAIVSALASLGHSVVELEADQTFPRAVLATRPDVVFNVSEGRHGRSREAQVPALLELLGIPYTGSDPASLVLTLDKAVAKAVVREAGLPTPRSFVVTTGDEPAPPGFSFPAIVKPVSEGSSKGVHRASVVTSVESARDLGAMLAHRYGQGALVEEFLPGREFTVGVVGDPAVALPPMEIVLDTRDEYPVYAFDHKLEPTREIRYEAPARVEPDLGRALVDLALASFRALGCRDVARIDLRLDREGRPSFVECNPLPGLTPGWSDLCMIAASAGIEYRALVRRILEPAIRRAGDRVPHPLLAASRPS